VDQRIDLLLECLQTQRCLLVLDNLETLLQEQDAVGRMCPGYEDYATLLSRVAQTPHQSCLLLTSREAIEVLEPLEASQSGIHTLRLRGLESEACAQFFDERELVGSVLDREQLVQRYVGNPLALNIVAETISELFGGEISSFLEQDVVIFSSLRDLLAEQWKRLSVLEQTVLTWLAIVREPIDALDLREQLVVPVSEEQAGAALQALQRRSLVEQGKQPGTFTLQSVVQEYVTEVLVEQVSEQIQQGVLEDLLRYALEQAEAREYVRQTQERLIVAPILLRLQAHFRHDAVLERWLLGLLDHIRTWDQEAQSYGPANLIALLHLLRGHLRNLDLSHLLLRGVFLQGVEMQDTSLAGSTLRASVLTERLDHTDAIAMSRRGTFWAAGSLRGEVRVWCEEGRRLHLIWQAHTDNTFTLAFSPDEGTLATGSWDGTVKLWDLHSGALLWSGWHRCPLFSVAFSSDGRLLASSDTNGCIKLWDVASGQQIQSLVSPGGWVFSVVWSPDGQYFAAGCLDGSIRLWQVQKNQLAPSMLTLMGHTNWVHTLAFSPDGLQLASGSWDGTVKLWDVTSGCEYQTLTKQTQRVYGVAWSPDGGTIASSNFEGTIWLWDVTEKCPRLALHGHRAVVHDLAFTPDSLRLLSGSEDATIRLWDVSSGQCIRTIEGYGTSFYDLAWSPDGGTLASASSDKLVRLWEVTGATPPRELRGHRWCVRAVMWNPDGRRLVSAGWDNSIRVWDPATGTCLQVLQDPDYPDTPFTDVAWSPDGSLLVAGDCMYRLHMWEMNTSTRCWLGEVPTWIHRVAWSPDGTRVACCENESVSLWKASDGTIIERLQWQQTSMLSVAWSPDGNLLACGGYAKDGGKVLIWETTSEHRDEPFQVLGGLAGAVFGVAWSPDGSVLISGESTGIIEWWKVTSGACLARRKGHQGAVQALEVAPNGHLLASCGDDSTIQVWDVASAELVRTLRRDRPYERLNITGLRGLTEAQRVTMCSLGSFDEIAGC
jgi:WD40 repeat protein